MAVKLYRVILVEIHALFPEILRFGFVTLFLNTLYLHVGI